MKKVLKVLSAAMLSAVVAVSAATVASAAGINADEQRILDELHTSVTMQGVEKYLPVDYINQAETYLQNVDLTASEANNVIAKIEEAKSAIEATGAANVSEISDAQFNQIASIAKEAAAAGHAEIRVSRTDFAKHPANVTLVNKDTGKGTGVIDRGTGGNGGNVGNGGIIKTTGFDVPSVAMIAGAGLLMVSAAGVYLMKTKKESVDA